MLTINTPCGYRTAREDLEPLTLIDARMPATVGAWVSRASIAGIGFVPWDMAPGLTLSLTRDGQWFTRAGRGVAGHADRAALVAYVVAWARGL